MRLRLLSSWLRKLFYCFCVTVLVYALNGGQVSAQLSAPSLTNCDIQSLIGQHPAYDDCGVLDFGCAPGAGSTATSASLDVFLQALAALESGDPQNGNPTATNPYSDASGRYQYLDSTWQSHSRTYYPPGQQYARAKDAPAPVQDAVVYIEYAKKALDFNGDVVKMAISHIYPAYANDPSQWDKKIGHNPTAREYAQIIVNKITQGVGQSIQLGYSSLPDFQTYLNKTMAGKTIPGLSIDESELNGSGGLVAVPGGGGQANCGIVCSPSGNISAPADASKKLDVAAIAKKYGLQSALVKQIGGDTIGSYNADQPPNQPASVLKLAIAHAFLAKHSDPEKYLKLLADMLQHSSNSAPNELMDAIGGPIAANKVIKSLGYSNTVLDYYQPKHVEGLTKTSTAADLTTAMEKVYTGTGPGYSTAQKSLQNDDYKFGLNSEANKWGGVSDTTGNSAVFAVNGSKYIITMYINKGWSPNSPSATAIRDATNEIVDALGGVTGTGTGSSSNCGVPTGSFVFYQQCDPRWKDKSLFGYSNFCDSGCGPTSVAMVVATLINSSITPVETGAYQTSISGFKQGEGSTSDGMAKTLQHFGLKTQMLGTNLDAAVKIIQSGGLVIAGGQGANPFSSGGHVIVLRGIDTNGNFLIGNSSLSLNDGSNDTAYSPAVIKAGLRYLIGVTK